MVISFMSSRFTSILPGNFMNVLRTLKAEVIERLKMFQHYGFFRRISPELETSIRRSSYNRNGYDLPEDLRAALARIRELNRIKTNTSNNLPRIAFISYTIPRTDGTSSVFRLFNILQILLKKRYKLDFLYCARLWNDSKYIKSFEGDISFTYLSLDIENYLNFLADKNPDYIWITELWRLSYVEFMSKLSRGVKKNCASSKLIVDTIDFHFKEFYRKYKITQNPDDLKRANEFLYYEEILYRQADIVFVVSKDEKRDVQDNISDIKRIEVIPNVHEISDFTRSFYKRRNICFVGHFGNKHNLDAAIYFDKKIFQLILEKDSRVKFHILGYGAEKYKNTFKSPNVKVIGGLKYLQEALQNYRLFVCPMTYGAGMKGKIGGAVAAGVPVVTTSIGAEGFPFRDGKECFITDCPKDFAEKCKQCLEDPVLWHSFSVKSRLVAAENFSPGAVARKLENIFFNTTN